MIRIARRALLAAALPAALAAAALPTAADAATAGVSLGNELVYHAAPGEPNNALVSVVNSEVVIDDQVAITAGNGCAVDGAGNARCPATVDRVTILLGDRSDVVRYTAAHPASVRGEDGDDVFRTGARVAAGRAIEPVNYSGGSGSDQANYDLAAGAVNVRLDNQPFDGRRNGIVSIDRENVQTDVERVRGTTFADVLFGSGSANVLRGGLGADEVTGNGGNDLFETETSADGADRYSGGSGIDQIRYGSRSSGVRVSLDGVPDDGATDEGDNVQTDVEQVMGTDFDDDLLGNDAPNTFFGFIGNDVLEGGGGADTISAGADFDIMRGQGGNDIIEARDGGREIVDCGADNDTADRDTSEQSVIGCEGGVIGQLRLSPRSSSVGARETARLRLSWRHPRDWRRLRDITLRLNQDGVTVGEVDVRPGRGRIVARGGVETRRASRLVHRGKTVTARLALRLDASLAGRVLEADVEATDVRGRRQLERGAGTLRVTR